jgi:large repetitive protein
MSFTFLAWLVALETYRFANKLGGPQPDAHDPAVKSYDIDGAGLSSRSDQVQPVHENAPPNAGTHPSRHAKVEDTKPDGLHENADPNHSVVGSSTDPRILAQPLPSNATINPITVGSPVLGAGVQGVSVDASSALANQMIVLPAAASTPDTTAPTVLSVAASGSGIDGAGNGDLNAGHVVTLTVTMSEVVTVAGGVPTLSLNNGGTASYTGGSGSTALTFSYTVGAGDDISDLAVTAFNLNGATVSDAAGNSADVAGAVINPTGLLQIDTIAPTVPSVAASGSGIDGAGNGDVNAGHVVTLTVSMSEVVTVAGGVPTLSLNNGGTASYTGGSGSAALTFGYTVAPGDDISDLAVTSFNLNGATVSDAAGNNADLSGAATNPAGVLQIDTIAPTVPTVGTSGSGIDAGGNGDLNAGHVVTLTLTMSEVVAIAGGVPTLSLNNGGTASYTGGSGSTALTFSYTVGAGDDINDLAVTAFNLNGATVSDAAGNSANVAGAVINPTGILQIDTIAPGSPVITNVALGGVGGNHWVLTGTAEANSTVIVFDGNTQLAAVTASGTGVWNYTTTGSVTNSSIHNFTATASDSAGNTSVPSEAWIEGSSGNDTFAFGFAAQLTAPMAISGNGGADGITMTAPVTLNGGDFANVSGVQSLQLSGASAVTLGADAATAGIVNVVIGNGTTSITGSNGVPLNVDTTALADNIGLSLSGSAGFTVTGLQGDLTAAGVSGALTVTAVAVASGLSIATGSGANTVTASALTSGQTLTLTGSSAATVTLNAGASTGNLAAGAYTGNLAVTGGSGANTITVGNGTNTITGGGGADLLTGGTGNDTFNFSSAANLGATATIAGGAGSDTIAVTAAATLTDASFLNATSIETLRLTGASTITLGANAASAGLVNVNTGTGATSITASNGVTLNVDATTPANNTVLTLVGSSAEVVSGLIGNITASALTGALTVTTGDATDNTIAITTGSAATSITDNFNTDTVTVTATALAQNTALTLAGSAAEVVTGLVGDIAAGSLTGALTVTTGNAADNGISIATGSVATSITASGAGDTVTVNATMLAQNTALTLTGSAAEVVSGLVGDIMAGSLTGALTVTTGDAADNGISITTGSAAISISASGAGDTVTINATAMTANTLTLTGSAAATVTLGTGGSLAAGADTGNLTVTGGSGVNTITVGSGNNTITGGGGADVLTGGAGSDHFVFNAISDSTVAARDSINNFVHGSDVIDTAAIAGITTIQGLITGGTQIAAHSIAWIQSGADTIVYANSSGVAENQAAADMAITLKSITASVLTGSDFIHQ